MARARKFANPKDQEIYEVHRRYIVAMEDRLSSIGDEAKIHYLAVLSSLTDKLAIPGKPLSEVVSEMMAEATPLIFRAMQR